jgi:hypothetical protein
LRKSGQAANMTQWYYDKDWMIIEQYIKWEASDFIRIYSFKTSVTSDQYCIRQDGGICKQCGGFGYQIGVHHIKSLRVMIIENHIDNLGEAWECKEL